MSANAQRYIEHEVRIPWVMAAPGGLDALLVYVDLPGKHPLVLLTHGTARKPEDQAQTTPWQQLPQALWFARRGWVALVVVRRGFGTSGGEKALQRCPRCPPVDYEEVGRTSAEDLRIAIDYARKLPQVDDTHILAVGHSTGGFATVALTADPPPRPGGGHQLCRGHWLKGGFGCDQSGRGSLCLSRLRQEIANADAVDLRAK